MRQVVFITKVLNDDKGHGLALGLGHTAGLGENE